MHLDYFIVDVFTRTPLEGNPLAVVLNTCDLATERMQAIAREFNLSETTFIERRAAAVERAEGVRVRIFTTHEELDFAGHPTLGTASVLKLHAPETVDGNTVTLRLNVGAVPVRFAGERLEGEMTQRDPEFGMELNRTETARLVGLSSEDLADAPPQVVSTGTAFAIVLLCSEEALARIKVNHDEATPWLREHGARWFYVLAPALDQNQGRSQNEFRARMQFDGGEDPATGSAAGCAIAWMVKHGVAPSSARVHLRQGIEIGRPSQLFLSARAESARVTDVRVGGSTVPVASGRLFLP
jgi:trans-2,3-dihydro-3-hydroxyanthranilate isomerase